MSQEIRHFSLVVERDERGVSMLRRFPHGFLAFHATFVVALLALAVCSLFVSDSDIALGMTFLPLALLAIFGGIYHAMDGRLRRTSAHRKLTRRVFVPRGHAGAREIVVDGQSHNRFETRLVVTSWQVHMAEGSLPFAGVQLVCGQIAYELVELRASSEKALAIAGDIASALALTTPRSVVEHTPYSMRTDTAGAVVLVLLEFAVGAATLVDGLTHGRWFFGTLLFVAAHLCLHELFVRVRRRAAVECAASLLSPDRV